MNNHRSLSVEQQFKLRVYRDEIEKMSQEQAQHYLLVLIQQMMLKDNILKRLLTQKA